MRYLLSTILLCVCTITNAADLTIELVRASGTAFVPPVASVDYELRRFNLNGQQIELVPGTVPFTGSVATVPLVGTAKTPVRVTVTIGSYTPIELEPLNPTKDHNVKMIVKQIRSVQAVRAEAFEVERRVLGSNSLRLQIIGDRSTAFDATANRLEVLSPIASADPTYNIYLSDMGGKWAVGKNVHVKCVIVQGAPCWVSMGVPVWRTDPTEQKWVSRGYLKELLSQITVEQKTLTDMNIETFYD